MKLKQLITGGALAATVLTIGTAQAEENNYEGIVFCKAIVVDPAQYDNESFISVTLPFTTTGKEGEQYTHWNVGKVPAGGVADSWHGNGKHGKFVTHNDGGVGAYVYLTSSNRGYCGRWSQNSENRPCEEGVWQEPDNNQFLDVFGDSAVMRIWPTVSLNRWRRGDGDYCLAFTCDMDASNPTWHLLSRGYQYRNGGSGSYVEWTEDEENGYDYIAAYMGYLPAGDYMPFDVKFWAPRELYGPVHFTFKVEAAAFPLWEHDIEVK